MTELAEVLQFIATIEQKNPGKSAYEIANILRAYTKPTYVTQMWTIATGYQQDFIEGKLNQDVTLAGEVTDFGHFIASLSDQINQPGLQWAFTRWTGDHTSWAGDIGSAIDIVHSQPDRVKSLTESLDRFASVSDYVADVAAFVVGAIVNSSAQVPLSKVIEQYSLIPYSDHVRTLIKQRFRAEIETNQIQNPAKIEAEIRNVTFAYLELAPDSGVLRAMKTLFSPKLKLESEKRGATIAADLLQGSLHFFTHLVKKGKLDPLKFKPYQFPQAPWLGTVSYEVRVSN